MFYIVYRLWCKEFVISFFIILGGDSSDNDSGNDSGNVKESTQYIIKLCAFGL
jgi:hypothetical protein